MTDGNETPTATGESVAMIEEPPKPKERAVKSIEIVSVYGTDKIVGVSSIEELPDRVNVTGHFEEIEEVEKDGKMERKTKNIPASVSVPRSAILKINKTYHK